MDLIDRAKEVQHRDGDGALLDKLWTLQATARKRKDNYEDSKVSTLHKLGGDISRISKGEFEFRDSNEARSRALNAFDSPRDQVLGNYTDMAEWLNKYHNMNMTGDKVRRGLSQYIKRRLGDYRMESRRKPSIQAFGGGGCIAVMIFVGVQMMHERVSFGGLSADLGRVG